MSQDSAKWKEKYLNSVDELEQQQLRSQNRQEQLQRALAKVSVAAQGQDAELDQLLEQLRSLLRDSEGDSTAALAALITQLEQRTVQIDDRRQQRNAQVLQALLTMLAQLRELAPDKKLKKQLKTFSRDLTRKFENLAERGPVLEAMAVQQQQALTCLVAEKAPARGFLQSLFAAKKPPLSTTAIPSAPPSAAPSEDADSHETAQAEATIECQDKEEEKDWQRPEKIEMPAHVVFRETNEVTPAFAKIADQVVQILKALVEQVDVPETVSEQAAQLRQQLQQQLNWYELIPVLENLSVIVLAALDRDMQDFEVFLKTAQTEQRDAQSDSRKLDEMVRSQVRTINEDVAQADDLEALKISVRSNLDAIVNSLDQFRYSRETRESSVAEQLTLLVERVANMEKESQLAKSNLEEQRLRLMLDSLTQLPNREAYQQRLQEEFLRWQRYARPLSLVVGDVDHFKMVNDSYGHLSGDKVLRVIARTLAKRLRKTDFVARYGGEEFVILMPETNTQQALQTIDAVREAIAQCPFHFHEQPISITMSFGIAEFQPEEQPEQVFERADKALYQAKSNGRNRCEIASESETSIVRS
jgi:diguanylate cyclase